jgi:hypothetical protein
MSEVILIGRQEQIIEVDAEQWRRQVAHLHHQPSTHLSFMTPDHHRIRNFAVAELPRSGGKPLSAQLISEHLSLPLPQVMAILDDLQQHLLFLVQHPAGEVRWAYPVTIEPTPHHMRFSSGERIYAA